MARVISTREMLYCHLIVSRYLIILCFGTDGRGRVRSGHPSVCVCVCICLSKGLTPLKTEDKIGLVVINNSSSSKKRWWW